MRGAGTAAVAAILACGTVRAAEAPPLDPAVLAQARAVTSLPCEGGGDPGGFASDGAAPPAWRIAGTLVSVRRHAGERVAFVLAAPAPAATTCAVRDVVAMPGSGTLLACALQDGSVQGIGVHTLLPNGRRDVLFWRADGAGGLRAGGKDGADYESDTGELICALPDPIP